MAASARLEQIKRTSKEIVPRCRLAVGASLLSLLSAFGAAVLTWDSGSRLTGGVEAASFFSRDLLVNLADVLPLGYAFGAGMAASVNPCGFGLLPAYLTLNLPSSDAGAAQRMARASQISVMATSGFVLLFGLIGSVLSLIGYGFANYFPWLSLAAGVAVILAGGSMLGGAAVRSGLSGRLAGWAGRWTHRRTMPGYLAYGVAYGAASLGCTLPIFLTVVGTSLTARGLVSSSLQFVMYGLGMGVVITCLTVVTATLGHHVAAKARQTGRLLEGASAVLMLLAGAYVVYYWLTIGGLIERFS